MDGFIRPSYSGPVTFCLPDPITGPNSSAEIVARKLSIELECRMNSAITLEVLNYDKWIYTNPEIGDNGGFFESVPACQSWCSSNGVGAPEFAFCCHSKIPQLLDYDELIGEQVFVDSFDDARDWVGLDVENAFRDAIDKFNEHVSKIVTHYADKSRKVRVKPL